MSTGQLKGQMLKHESQVNKLVISPDGSLVASGSESGEILLWDLNEQRLLRSWSITEPVLDLAFSPVRYWLAVLSKSGTRVYVRATVPSPSLPAGHEHLTNDPSRGGWTINRT